MNEIVIQLTKCVLVLYENEVFNGLNPELLATALKRGKGYKRVEKVQARNESIKPQNENILTGRN